MVSSKKGGAITIFLVYYCVSSGYYVGICDIGEAVRGDKEIV